MRKMLVVISIIFMVSGLFAKDLCGPMPSLEQIPIEKKDDPKTTVEKIVYNYILMTEYASKLEVMVACYKTKVLDISDLK